jgi:hypothetical protein
MLPVKTEVCRVYAEVEISGPIAPLVVDHNGTNFLGPFRLGVTLVVFQIELVEFPQKFQSLSNLIAYLCDFSRDGLVRIKLIESCTIFPETPATPTAAPRDIRQLQNIPSITPTLPPAHIIIPTRNWIPQTKAPNIFLFPINKNFLPWTEFRVWREISSFC